MAISFVAAGTAYTNTSSGTSFTLNKPSGVADGDVMVAFVAFWVNGNSALTVTAPTGWTKQQTAFRDAGSDQFELCMMTRVAGSSEPSSWSGSLSASGFIMGAGVAAYRGVQTIGASAQGVVSSGTSVSTGNVTASVTGTWRVVCGAYFDDDAASTIGSNESSRRILATADSGSGASQGAIWDSNGTTVSAGTQSRSVTRSSSWLVACASILLLEPQTGTPATGTFDSNLHKVVAAGTGEIHNDASWGSTLGHVVATWSGYGQPPVATGSFASSLSKVVFSGTGATDVRGSFNSTLPITFEGVGETRVFGIRVVEVEFDKSRIITVQSRAVDD